jgi:eukaryotic-like serine/threonine-protein kinase
MTVSLPVDHGRVTTRLRGYPVTVLSAGDLLGGRYRLDGPVAGGGMGEVWRATDLALSRTVAVKILRPALLADPSFAARFQAEARTMAALNHSHVANVYDFGRDDSVTYLVMAYVDGRQLAERIATSGRLPAGETMAIVAQAADALDAAHRLGIVHRDVKPANLLISADGTVTLVDFGIARQAAATTALTSAQEVLGTALYMAPEQVSGGAVGPPADIYALGAVAYHALAGQPPFPGENPLEIALRHLSDTPPPLPDDVPAAVRTVVERAMAREPADRYPSAADLAAAARTALVEPDAPVADTVALPVPAAARRRRDSVLVGAVLLLVLSVVGLFLLATAAPPASTGTVHPPAPSVVPSGARPSAVPGAVGGTTPAARPSGTAPSTAPPPASSAPAPAPSPSTAPSPVISASVPSSGGPASAPTPSVSPALFPK